MANSPNKLSRFWQELKRRRVHRMLAIYAGSAYVVFEASTLIFPRWGLPDWTIDLVLYLLILGAIITFIVSWIYDFTTDGIVITKSFEDASKSESSQGNAKRRIKISDVIIVFLFITVCVLLYPKIFNSDKFENIRDEDGRISVAVIPFENLTGDTTLNWFQKGISSLIINGLANSTELAVRDDYTMHEAIEITNRALDPGLTSSQAKMVAEMVHAETYITGSCQGRDGKYWILANLVNTQDGNIIWSGKVEGNLNSSEYLDLAFELSKDIKDILEIKVLERETEYDFRDAYTESAEAYRHYVDGLNSILALDYEKAIFSLSKALDIDSIFTFAVFYIAYAYGYDIYFGAQPELRNEWTQKAYKKKSSLPLKYQYLLEIWYASYISKNLRDHIRYSDLLEKSGIESRILWFDLGVGYYRFPRDYEKAVKAFEKVEQISLKRGGDWKYHLFYRLYAEVLHKTGQHEKEKTISELGMRYFPEKASHPFNQAVCAWSRKDSIFAENMIQRGMSVLRDDYGFGEVIISNNKGYIYELADNPSKAEYHYRHAFNIDPGYIPNLIDLSDLLIRAEMNVEEGLRIAERGLKFIPDSPDLLKIKGWGLYKQGKYAQALELLRNAESFFLSYNYELDNQIREVEQAISKQYK